MSRPVNDDELADYVDGAGPAVPAPSTAKPLGDKQLGLVVAAIVVVWAGIATVTGPTSGHPAGKPTGPAPATADPASLDAALSTAWGPSAPPPAATPPSGHLCTHRPLRPSSMATPAGVQAILEAVARQIAGLGLDQATLASPAAWRLHEELDQLRACQSIACQLADTLREQLEALRTLALPPTAGRHLRIGKFPLAVGAAAV